MSVLLARHGGERSLRFPQSGSMLAIANETLKAR
jgi:hypothetical protein